MNDITKVLNYDPADPDKMLLPAGDTCGNCRHIHRCKAMFGHTETDTYCDWSPSRFIPAKTAGGPMNDITALAQREKFESWWEENYHNGNPPRFGWAYWREAGGYKIEDDEPELDSMWNAWEAASVALVEVLEARDKQIAEHNFENRLLANADRDIKTLRQRIAELESRTVTVKSLTPEVCNALKAEGLADVLRDAAEYAPLTAGQWVTLTKNWHQTFIGLSGDAAGIQVIEGEQKNG